MIGIPSKTTLRLGAMPTGTLPTKPTTSAWWVQAKPTLRIVPAGTRPFEDLKHLMHGHPATIIQNLNPDFNAIRIQTIMESIQRMVLEGSPLMALA
jgi:hypothetical protein